MRIADLALPISLFEDKKRNEIAGLG